MFNGLYHGESPLNGHLEDFVYFLLASDKQSQVQVLSSGAG